MAIIKTRAVPLAVYPFGNTSCTVHWLTAESGRISTMLKGAYRPKSLFTGQFDCFSTSELLYYHREKEGLMIAKECALLTPRSSLHRNWRNALAASYITALFSRTVPQNAHTPGLLNELERALDAAEASRAPEKFIYWYELQFCEQHGHRPVLHRCSLCGKLQTDRREPIFFSAAAGGRVEARCAEKQGLSTQPLNPDTLAILKNWQQSVTPLSAERLRCTAAQQKQIHQLLGRFMAQHFEIPPTLRDTAFVARSG
jgi:DNA repair protein RecO (recombination protein O)